MPQPRTGKSPVFDEPYSPPFLPKTSILLRDFDNIPEAEGEYRDLCLKGAKLEVDVPRTS